jgi:hypothetical protein
MQSKFFPAVRPSDRAKYQDSFTRAVGNFKGLRYYYICVPFNPTPSVMERRGGKGELEKLKLWSDAFTNAAQEADQSQDIQIIWWFASELKSQLLDSSGAEGKIAYWFNSTVISRKLIDANLIAAGHLAGRRYSPELNVGTDINLLMEAFGRTSKWRSRSMIVSRRLGSLLPRMLGPSRLENDPGVKAAINHVEDIKGLLGLVRHSLFDEYALSHLLTSCSAALVLAKQIETFFKTEFDSRYGSQSDNKQFRQFQADAAKQYTQ